MKNSNTYTEKEFFLEKIYNITEKVRLGIYDEPDLETILNVSDVLPRDSNDYLKIKKKESMRSVELLHQEDVIIKQLFVLWHQLLKQ